MANNIVECVACGHVGATKLRGSTIITVILICFYIIPGLMYMAWRRGGGVCSACSSTNVRLYDPRNRQQQGVQMQSSDINVQQIQCPDCREYIRYDARKCKHCGSLFD